MKWCLMSAMVYWLTALIKRIIIYNGWLILLMHWQHCRGTNKNYNSILLDPPHKFCKTNNDFPKEFHLFYLDLLSNVQFEIIFQTNTSHFIDSSIHLHCPGNDLPTSCWPPSHVFCPWGPQQRRSLSAWMATPHEGSDAGSCMLAIWNI